MEQLECVESWSKTEWLSRDFRHFWTIGDFRNKLSELSVIRQTDLRFVIRKPDTYQAFNLDITKTNDSFTGSKIVFLLKPVLKVNNKASFKYRAKFSVKKSNGSFEDIGEYSGWKFVSSSSSSMNVSTCLPFRDFRDDWTSEDGDVTFVVHLHISDFQHHTKNII